MRVNPFQFLLICAATAVFDNCSRESDFESGDASRIPICVSGQIDQRATKANALGFVDKDALGLYAVNYLENNTIPGDLLDSGNQADNVKYIFDEGNHKWVPVHSVYYKDVNTNVDLYLYYPYQSGISSVTASGFEVRKDQSSAATPYALSGYEASDYLWGKAANVSPTESATPVLMQHRLSGVQVTLVPKDGFAEGEFESLSKSIILMNTTRKATINYTTGVATAVGRPQVDGIVMCPQEDGTFRAIVIPQTVGAGVRLFSITLGGVVYGFTQGQEVSYQAGKQLNVAIQVTKKTPSGEYELELGETQIVDWTEDRNTHGGEARQYYIVTLDTPGTLGRTIKSAGKNPNKIRNIKVCGPVTDADFYFMRDSMAILEAVNMREAQLKDNRLEYTDLYRDGEKVRVSEIRDNCIPADAFREKESLIYFVFPEKVEGILGGAFYLSGLAGPLIIPEDVTFICSGAFRDTRISSLSLSSSVQYIGFGAFYNCQTLTGQLLLPQSLEYIDEWAFYECGFSGRLYLPDKVKFIGGHAFHGNRFIGSLVIPELVRELPECAFASAGFSGSLDLGNVIQFGNQALSSCGFQNELVIPEGVLAIPDGCFTGNNFSSIVFPSTLRTIGGSAFESNTHLITPLVFPEGLISIGRDAFRYCLELPAIVFPSSLQTILNSAFSQCYYVSSIVCKAAEPATVRSGAFDGVPKDNFTVEVPAESVRLYQAEVGWSDFKRIGPYYDFSVSKKLLRALNEEYSQTIILRAPAGNSWHVVDKPDWVTVTPSSGTGKTEISVIVNQMERTNDTFSIIKEYYDEERYHGRRGLVQFGLDGRDYTTELEVQQYDYEYGDGESKTIQTATRGTGINIVFIGDGYDAKDIASGNFVSDAEEGARYIFDIEPFSTYKDYFNVSAVLTLSDESGIGSENTKVDTKFGTYITQKERIKAPDDELCFYYAAKGTNDGQTDDCLIVLMMNTPMYEGVCVMYGDGSSIACCPVSRDTYPFDYRGIIQHEAGGHGFGHLDDEYIYFNAYYDGLGFESKHQKRWFLNVSTSSSPHEVPWAHLIFNPQYSDYVDMYEGAEYYSRGIYRSEATSCMNNNIPYYSAISRQAIVERILTLSGEGFTFEKFIEKDSDRFGTYTKSNIDELQTNRTFPKNESCIILKPHKTSNQ